MFIALLLLRIALVVGAVALVAEILAQLLLGRSLFGMARTWLAGGPSEMEILVEQRRSELRRAARDEKLARQAFELSERLDATLEQLDETQRQLDEAEARLTVTADLGDHPEIATEPFDGAPRVH